MRASQQQNETGKRIVRFLSKTVDNIVLVLLVILMIIAFYAYYDSNQVYSSADKEQFETYKPAAEDTTSFADLQAMNPDVLGWLTVYDTGIDYPLVRSEKSNDEYLSLNAKREVATSGSLFLDHRNARDFSDFNTVIFGHHMENSVMFGDVDKFLDQSFFAEHQYGNLYYDGADHGVEFFAMLTVDSYDDTLYRIGLSTTEAKQEYLTYIDSHAVNKRSTSVTTEDHLILLSTCASDITNGRYVLVGKILDHTVDNPFPEEEKNTGTGIDTQKLKDILATKPAWFWILILLFIILLIYFITEKIHEKRTQKGENKDEQDLS